MMKKALLIIMAFLLMAGSTLTAQTKQGPKPQKMSDEQLSRKVAARMAQCLELDAEKTAKFVPIYVDYRKELKQVWDKYTRPCAPKAPPAANTQRPSDKELEQMAANRFARSRATIDVEEAYYKRFLTVLSQQQYEKMLQLERMHLQRMKNEKMRRQQQKKPQCFKCPPPNNGDAKQRKAPVAFENTKEIKPVEQQGKKPDHWVSMNGTPVDGMPTTSGYYINQGRVVRISQ
jgi:hypothetical protein